MIMTRELYTPERLATYDARGLEALAEMVQHDVDCPNSIYLDMTREETVATAIRSRTAILAELETRTAAQNQR
jgi:hypothetical protein